MYSLFFLVLCGTALAVPHSDRPFYALEDAEDHFEQFIQDFDKKYESEDEKEYRFEIFKQKLHYINELNSDPDETAEFGITMFSDISEDELTQYRGLDASLHEPDWDNIVNVTGLVVGNLPENFDWRQRGAVTRVKNQGQCGSCWAFSSTGALEGAFAIKHRRLLSFSEQQLVDCDTSNNGCNGGLMTRAFQYYIRVGGAMLESSYPYRAVKGTCRFQRRAVQARVTRFTNFNLQSEEALRGILHSTGPIAIALDSTTLQHHRGSGIIRNCVNRRVDHAVLLTGYGTDSSGTPFWIIKNSWGTAAGDRGYHRIIRNRNACGILNNLAAVPVVA